jgi:hypothetical protein
MPIGRRDEARASLCFEGKPVFHGGLQGEVSDLAESPMGT